MNQVSRFDDELEEQRGPGMLAHLPAILWQRRWFVIVPWLLAIVAAAIAAVLISPVYRSTALMLVQSPQLPTEVVGDNGGGEVIDRRIARIKEQITSRPDLIALIEAQGLYDRERARKPLSDVIQTMRDAITLTPTTVDVPGGRADQRTVAFELAFDYREPAQSQAVAQALMDRVVELDSSGNAEQATNTVQFLSDQAKALQADITRVQSEIAVITAQNGGVLANSGMAMINGNSGSYDVQIAALQRDNSNLISQRELSKNADTRDPAVITAESALAAARAVYSESHPDVVLAKQRLAEARELAKNDNRRAPTDTIDQQIAFNNNQIAALRAAKAGEQAQISATLNSQARAPLVQQKIADLQQQLTGLNQQYQTVAERLRAAQAGVRAEDEQMGERLTVVDPPVLPDSPVKPNRWLIMALGFFGGLGAGVVLAAFIELVLKPIRDPEQLARVSGVPSLGTVPLLDVAAGPTWRSRLSRWRRSRQLARQP